MTLRDYCEQTGLRIIRDLSPLGHRCTIAGFRLADSCGKPEASAEGPTPEAALAALTAFVSERTLQSIIRPTYRLWVPELTPERRP